MTGRNLIVCAFCALMVAPAAAETLQEKLDREKAALDSLNSALEKDRKFLSQTELQKVSFGSELDRLQKENAILQNRLAVAGSRRK